MFVNVHISEHSSSVPATCRSDIRVRRLQKKLTVQNTNTVYEYTPNYRYSGTPIHNAWAVLFNFLGKIDAETNRFIRNVGIIFDASDIVCWKSLKLTFSVKVPVKLLHAYTHFLPNLVPDLVSDWFLSSSVMYVRL